jgi:hypothetical protein
MSRSSVIRRVRKPYADWIELPDPPASWNAGRQAHLLLGALALVVQQRDKVISPQVVSSPSRTQSPAMDSGAAGHGAHGRPSLLPVQIG